VAPGALLGWLITTATREALRMLRAGRREVSLDAAMSAGAEVIELPTRSPGPDDLAELHERLAEVRRLPVRQQRMVWLTGLGFDYREIGACTGDTHRTVERQLHQARHRLRDST
jgi:DNA-directed RNA polymerase specialized sigma24 family protein